MRKSEEEIGRVKKTEERYDEVRRGWKNGEESGVEERGRNRKREKSSQDSLETRPNNKSMKTHIDRKLYRENLV